MSELDELRRENAALREQLAEAREVLAACARSEVDAAAEVTRGPPMLLQVAHEELRQSRSLFGAVFDGTLDALLLADDRDVYVEANAAACELFGVPRDELIGQSIANFTPRGVDAQRQFRSFVEQGQMRGQFRLQRPDGTSRVLEFSAVANVAPGRHLSALRDVTDRVAVEEALRRSEARFRAMVEKSHDGISLLNAEVRAIYQSPAVERMLGYSANETRQLAWEEFVDEDERPKLAGAVAKLMEAPGTSVELEFRIHTRDGSPRWLDLCATNWLEDPDIGAIVSNFRDVTARKSIEEEGEGFFRLSLDLLCIIGLDGRFRRLNPAWETTLGWSLEELSSHPAMDFVHPDDRAATVDQNARLAGGAAAVGFENRFRCKNGNYRRLQWSWIPSRESGFVYACARDVTDQRAAAERDRLLFAASPVPIWLLDAETLRIVDANDAAVASVGYERERLYALTLFDIVVAEQHADLRARMAELHEKGTVHVSDRRHRTKDGDVRDVIATHDTLTVGTRRMVLSVLIDATEQKRAEAELRVSERRYRRIVDNASEGIWIYDAAGMTTFMNPSMAKMLGVTPEEALGKPILAFVDDEGCEEVSARIARRTLGIRERGELRLTKGDGSHLWVAVRADPLLDEHGRFENALALVTDITERRRAEEALRRSQEQLRQAQKMEAIGSLAGGVAHEGGR